MDIDTNRDIDRSRISYITYVYVYIYVDMSLDIIV